MVDVRKQVVAGLVPPEVGEALIRQVWPSVAAYPAVAGVGRALTNTIIGAPLGWLMMAPFYFLKVLPILGRRYTLTNRRLMVRRGIQAKPGDQVALSDIEDVHIARDANSDFYRAADLEIKSCGKTALVLKGVPEPESFRHSILQAVQAWTPRKPAGPFVPAKETAPVQGTGATA